ncbi:MAG: hypothetical protein PHC66_03245 [Candidatus Nanoarchaeia archaeon]|nr:hypothetical protein [Candidatus Nanoarchaeia archaeon]MDD5239864.1 hypothetical protein [Candidatus Nanoarchaeia archaeon]
MPLTPEEKKKLEELVHNRTNNPELLTARSDIRKKIFDLNPEDEDIVFGTVSTPEQHPEQKQYTEEEILAYLNDPENKREMIRRHHVHDYINNINSSGLPPVSREKLLERIYRP